jgi:hypothetical protein
LLFRCGREIGLGLFLGKMWLVLELKFQIRVGLELRSIRSGLSSCLIHARHFPSNPVKGTSGAFKKYSMVPWFNGNSETHLGNSMALS